LVKCGSVVGFGDSKAGGSVALGVGVDNKDAEVVGGEGSSEVNGSGGFANAAFLML